MCVCRFLISITKLSAIFDMVEVSEIGRRSLLKSETIGALGSGGTLASFHTRGTLTSEKEAFKMTAMGTAKISLIVMSLDTLCCTKFASTVHTSS